MDEENQKLTDSNEKNKEILNKREKPINGNRQK